MIQKFPYIIREPAFKLLLMLRFEILLSTIFPGARLSDSGNVKCIATNLLGKASSTAQLMIEGIYMMYEIIIANYIVHASYAL